MNHTSTAKDTEQHTASASEQHRISTELPSADKAIPNSGSPTPEDQHAGVSENFTKFVGAWQSWCADLCELFVAESRFALLCLTAWCVLSLLLALTLFLVLLSALSVAGLLLFDLSVLEPVHIAALILAATLIFSLSILGLIRSISKKVFLNATVQQIRGAFPAKPNVKNDNEKSDSP